MTLPPPWRLQSFPVLASTQDACRALAQAGEPGRLAIRAERQSAGRGTGGRSWQSPPGNLSLSVLLRPDIPAREATRLGLLAGVALAETTEAVLAHTGSLRLKWPNDLLLDGRKLAGILTESAAGPDGRLDWAVLGFGVNLACAPEVPGRPTACVADCAVAPEPEVFASHLLARLDWWLDRHVLDGFAAVRAGWLRYAPEPGSPLRVRVGAGSIEGAFAGLSEDGHLQLQSDGAVCTFAAGEI